MRILLTGPSGFLGSALARHWMRQGHELWLLARPTSDLSRLGALGPMVRLSRAANAEDVSHVIKEASPEAIVHVACSYGRKGETALEVFEANMYYGVALLQAALHLTAGKSRPLLFINTGTVLSANVSLYALSKTQFSTWGATLATKSPQLLQFIDVKLQQMYGSGDHPSKFTTHVIEACRSNEPRLALTEGEQLRDFIHIDDVVLAYDQILAHASNFSASDTIDVGTGEAIAMREFVETVREVSGSKTLLDFGAVGYRANEAMLCVADTTRLRDLGWKPSIDLREGLRRLLERPNKL